MTARRPYSRLSAADMLSYDIDKILDYALMSIDAASPCRPAAVISAMCGNEVVMVTVYNEAHPWRRLARRFMCVLLAIKLACLMLFLHAASDTNDAIVRYRYELAAAS